MTARKDMAVDEALHFVVGPHGLSPRDNVVSGRRLVSGQKLEVEPVLRTTGGLLVGHEVASSDEPDG
jgi:hypothetical protein